MGSLEFLPCLTQFGLAPRPGGLRTSSPRGRLTPFGYAVQSPVQLAHLLLELGCGAVHRQARGDGLDGQGSDRAGGTSHPRSQPTSCSVDTAYTMRPRPTHAWAAEHIAQCSPEV